MNIRDWLRRGLILVLAGVFCYSGWQLWQTNRMYEEGEQAYEEIADQFVVPVTAPAWRPKPPLPDRAPEDSQPTQPPPAVAPIEVDFLALREMYPDVVGWIYSPDTPINYPIVQGKDNNHYLRRKPDGTYDYNGCIFMDWRNDPGLTDWMTMIYGHNMRNEAMFGSLTNYERMTYLQEHPVIYLLTPEQDFALEILGGYTTTHDSAIYRFPADSRERNEVVDLLYSSAKVSADVVLGEEDKLVLFSTCDYDFDLARFVVLGVLRPLERLEEPAPETTQATQP